MELAELVHVDLREAWSDEAQDFTPWLADNLQRLGSILGFDLEHLETEAAVGDFSADIFARETNTGRLVIIENQLTRTDHDHLGKLITYASGLDAGLIVWIAQELREEHRQALDWLNRHSDGGTEFFGIVVELVRIGESSLAPNFKLAAYPNNWSKTQKSFPRDSKEKSEKRETYRAFFQELIDELRDQHRFTNARKAQPNNWYTFTTGVNGIKYSLSFAADRSMRVEIYIDLGDANQNEAVFDFLSAKKDELESAIGEKMSWEPIEGKRACRVAWYKPDSSPQTSQTDELKQCAVARLLKLKEVFGPELREAADYALLI